MIVSAWLGSLALVRAGSVEERDPYWQVRAGLENLEGLPLVRTDTWGWDPVDAPFLQTSPVWNDALALGWSAGRFVGIFVVALLSIGLYLVTVVLLSCRLGARARPVLVGALVCVLPALAMLSPRATLVAQTIFLLGLLAADAWRSRPTRPPMVADALVVLVAAAVLVAVGSWVHLSWLLLAAAMVGCWAVLWLSGPAVPTARAVGLSAASAAGAVVGLLVGPYGTDAWTYSRQVQQACAGLVVEWLGVLTPGLVVRWLPAALIALAIAGSAAWWVVRSWSRRREDARVGLVAALIVLALPATLAAFAALRFVGVALLILVPVAALTLTVVSDRLRVRAAEEPPSGPFRNRRVRFWAEGSHWRPVLLAVVVLLFPGTLLLTAPLARPLPELAVIDSLPRDCRLLSDPSSAGPVLLLRPDVTVWIDGRFDHWGRARLVEAGQVLSSTDLTSGPASRASCVLLSSSDPFADDRLATALDASPAWAPLPGSGQVRGWVRTG